MEDIHQHPNRNVCQRRPSGKWLCSFETRTEKLTMSFFPKAIWFMNTQLPQLSFLMSIYLFISFIIRDSFLAQKGVSVLISIYFTFYLNKCACDNRNDFISIYYLTWSVLLTHLNNPNLFLVAIVLSLCSLEPRVPKVDCICQIYCSCIPPWHLAGIFLHAFHALQCNYRPEQTWLRQADINRFGPSTPIRPLKSL